MCQEEIELKRAELTRQREEAAAAGDTFKVRLLDSQIAELEEQNKQDEQWTPPNPDVLEYPLPMDYNDIFGNTGANDEIRTLLSNALQVAAYNYAANLEDLRRFYASKMDILKTANVELAERSSHQQIRIADLERDYDELRGLVDKLTKERNQLELEKNHADNYRDNAVAQIEEARMERDKAIRDADNLRGHIDELERLLAAQKRTQNVGVIGTMDTSRETLEERKERLKRMQQETLNRNLERWNIEPLRLPEQEPAEPEQEVTDKQLEAAFPSVPESEAVVCDDSGVDGVEEAAEAEIEAGDAETRAITLAEQLQHLEQRVEHLERWKSKMEEPVNMAV